VSPPIHPLASSQGAVFLINSRQAYFSCGPSCEGQALLLTYGRFFAEFLEDLSLVRLGLLDLTTCVGFRYGSNLFNLRSFSWKRAPRHLLPRRVIFSLCSGLCFPDFPGKRPRKANANPIMRIVYNTPSPHRNKFKSWNINHVSIGFGFRHPLRPD